MVTDLVCFSIFEVSLILLVQNPLTIWEIRISFNWLKPATFGAPNKTVHNEEDERTVNIYVGWE